MSPHSVNPFCLTRNCSLVQRSEKNCRGLPTAGLQILLGTACGVNCAGTVITFRHPTLFRRSKEPCLPLGPSHNQAPPDPIPTTLHKLLCRLSLLIISSRIGP